MYKPLHAVAFLSLCAGLALSGSPAPAPGYRLLQFEGGRREWVSPERVDELAIASRRTSFVDVTDDTQQEETLRARTRAVAFPAAPSHQGVVEPMLTEISMGKAWKTMRHLSSYKNRHYDSPLGLEAAEWLASELRSIAANYSRADVTVEVVVHSWQQPSIVAKVAGAASPNTVVAISSHIDTVKSKGPGADDNGSGVAAMLEAYRVIVSQPIYRPGNSLHFMFFSGEEAGMRGSKSLSKRYAADESISFVGLMNFDMVGYACKNKVIGIVSDYTDEGMNEWTRSLVREYCSLPLGKDTCGYGCSDHYPFHQKGFRTVYPFECAGGDMNPYMHTSQDTLDKLTSEHMHEFIKLGIANLVELSFSA